MLQFSDIAYMDDVGIHVLFSNNVRELFSPNMSKPSKKKFNHFWPVPTGWFGSKPDSEATWVDSSKIVDDPTQWKQMGLCISSSTFGGSNLGMGQN
jgi:hypothetical protein